MIGIDDDDDHNVGNKDNDGSLRIVVVMAAMRMTMTRVFWMKQSVGDPKLQYRHWIEPAP